MARRIFIGDRLRAFRLAREWTQDQLGEMAGIGRTDINSIENNRRSVGDDVLARLAGAFGITPDDLLEPQSEQVVPSSTDERLLLDLLATLEEHTEASDPGAVVVEVLGLLAHRVRLVEKRLAQAELRATGG